MHYVGKFVVINRTTLGGVRPKSGEIIVHRTDKGLATGQIILRCPYCNALQFVAAKVEGEEETPTITTEIKCGCRQHCGKSFRIRSGELHEELEATSRSFSPQLSESMIDRGVFYMTERKLKR